MTIHAAPKPSKSEPGAGGGQLAGGVVAGAVEAVALVPLVSGAGAAVEAVTVGPVAAVVLDDDEDEVPGSPPSSSDEVVEEGTATEATLSPWSSVTTTANAVAAAIMARTAAAMRQR